MPFNVATPLLLHMYNDLQCFEETFKNNNLQTPYYSLLSFINTQRRKRVSQTLAKKLRTFEEKTK